MRKLIFRLSYNHDFRQIGSPWAIRFLPFNLNSLCWSTKDFSKKRDRGREAKSWLTSRRLENEIWIQKSEEDDVNISIAWDEVLSKLSNHG